MTTPPITLYGGLRTLPERTFEHDLALLDRYQSLSAEGLRLSLLGITALGALYTIAFVGTTPNAPLSASLGSTRNAAAAALVGFGGAACACLAHRYSSTRAMTEHLDVLRDAQGSLGVLASPTSRSVKTRNRYRGASTFSLLIAGLFFVVGVVAFSWICGVMITRLTSGPTT
jgi:amino acid transporter